MIHLAALSVEDLVTVGIVAFLGVVAWGIQWAWTHTHKRIDDSLAYTGKAVDEISKDIALKADNAELTRVRDTQNSIFLKIADHDRQDQDRHGQVMHTIGKLEGKVDTLLNRRRGSEG